MNWRFICGCAQKHPGYILVDLIWGSRESRHYSGGKLVCPRVMNCPGESLGISGVEESQWDFPPFQGYF